MCNVPDGRVDKAAVGGSNVDNRRSTTSKDCVDEVRSRGCVEANSPLDGIRNDTENSPWDTDQ